jgi:hypothetical protein
MRPTPEQILEIIHWGHQHRQMLREKYRRKFVAYSATRMLAAGSNWDLVEALATAEGDNAVDANEARLQLNKY